MKIEIEDVEEEDPQVQDLGQGLDQLNQTQGLALEQDQGLIQDPRDQDQVLDTQKRKKSEEKNLLITIKLRMIQMSKLQIKTEMELLNKIVKLI